MFKQLLLMSLFINTYAIGMYNTSLSTNQLIAIARTTVVAQNSAKVLLNIPKESAVSSDSIPAKIALEVGRDVANTAENRIPLTDTLIKEMIAGTLANQFRDVARRKINRIVNEEAAKLPDGIVPVKK